MLGWFPVLQFPLFVILHVHCVRCLCELTTTMCLDNGLMYSIILLYLKTYNAFYIGKRSHSYFNDFRFEVISCLESVRIASRVESLINLRVNVVLW